MSDVIEKMKLTLTKDNYQPYFDAYIAPRHQQVDAFVAMVNQVHGEDYLDFSVESLDRAWHFVRDRVKRIKTTQGYPDPEKLPVWLRVRIGALGDPREYIVTEETLDFVDKLTFYYAEVVMRKIPNVRWVPCLEPIQHISSYLPYIANFDWGKEPREGFSIDPYIYISGLIRRYFKDKSNRKSLIASFNSSYEYYQEFLALPDEEKYPPPPPPFEVQGRKKKADWMGSEAALKKSKGYFEVEITPLAEDELGDEVFSQLEKHIEGIDGVEEIHWYDRECMHVASILSKKALAQALNDKYAALSKPRQA